jgi:Zn-dependent oligopeptidase
MDELEEIERLHLENAKLCLILASKLRDFRLNGIVLDDESKQKVIESDQEILNQQTKKDKLKSQIQKIDQWIRVIKYRDKRNREMNQKRK